MSHSLPPGFIIAGTHSGVGKTTVSFALMSLLADRGFVVQPFKIGPDFIDPGYHRLATHQVSVNLDLWMMGLEEIRANLDRYARSADVAVVEAMGALHDGENGTDRGSAAYFARKLNLPVVLVVDVWGMTRSTEAVVRGFEGLDPRVEIAGLVLNRTGSRRHFEMVCDALPAGMRRRVVGYLPAAERLSVGERHLGLVTVEENPQAHRFRDEVIAQARETLDVGRLVETFAIRRRYAATGPSTGPAPKVRARVGLARDRAFCFYYQENLRLLREAGAELVPFSPIADHHLPRDLDGIYFGGGYPESFAGELAANLSMGRELRQLAARGAPVYAECGGLMYLAETLVGYEGRRHAMAGLLPLEVAMDRSHLAIRYVEIETTRESLLGPAGTLARGQEFHQSRILSSRAHGGCYRVRDSTDARSTEGITAGNVLGSYVHLYFGSNRRISQSFVELCCHGGGKAA